MPIQTITLAFPNINVSVQIGDLVYYSTPDVAISTFDASSLDSTFILGLVTAITPTTITVEYDDSITSPPGPGAFIFFQKDKKVNMSSILGYYVRIDFENDSREKAELFSVGSEVTQSSK